MERWWKRDFCHQAQRAGQTPCRNGRRPQARDELRTGECPRQVLFDGMFCLFVHLNDSILSLFAERTCPSSRGPAGPGKAFCPKGKQARRCAPCVHPGLRHSSGAPGQRWPAWNGRRLREPARQCGTYAGILVLNRGIAQRGIHTVPLPPFGLAVKPPDAPDCQQAAGTAPRAVWCAVARRKT